MTGESQVNIPSSEINYPTHPRTCPSDTELQALADLLNNNSNITLFCGIGAKDAHEEIVELSHRLKAPVAYSFKSKMEIQYDNPNEVGMTGLLGMASGYNSMHAADVLVLLGTDFPYGPFFYRLTIKSFRSTSIPVTWAEEPKYKWGYAEISRRHSKLYYLFLQAKSDKSFLNDQLLGYSKVIKDLNAYVENKGSDNKIHPEYVMAMVDETAQANAIFTVDTGMTCVWGARYLKASGQRKMLGSFNHGTMANAMPQAIGASFAYPGRQVIALCGDGGISMLLGDLATIAQYKLPVKIIVFNNRSLGMVKLEMEVAGLPDNETDMQNPDFALVAQAMGIKSYTVSRPDDVLPVLVEALNSPEAALLNVMTDPNALAMPPQIEWNQMTGFAQAMYKMLLTGRTQEIIDTINSNYKHLKEIL